jgi:hypothetical protein
MLLDIDIQTWKIQYAIFHVYRLVSAIDGIFSIYSKSHRLVNYLEPHFPGWNVDCEYNRNHDDKKQLDIHPRKLQSDDTQATTVFPDIIIHRRGTEENLVVIEMMKTSSTEKDDYDLGKLNAFKNQLGYQYAIFLKFQTKDRYGVEDIKWV